MVAKDPRPKKLKVLITVKTYPTLSTKYEETVCTAGITENGDWIRLYPIPFRKLDYPKRYPKYAWVEMTATQRSDDARPESYTPDISSLKVSEPIPTDRGAWLERRKLVTEKVKIYTNLTELIAEAKNREKCTSLALFKPSKILDFTWKEASPHWDKKKVAAVEASMKQLSFFDTEPIENPLRVVDKVPFTFRFLFEDEDGKKSHLMIEDWETGMLYWKCLKSRGNKEAACKGVKERYLDDFARTKDLYFYLGTTKAHHFTSPNPFIIIGAFYPKHPGPKQLSWFG